MSVIRKIPYIELLLGSMTETNLKKLRTIINSGGNNVDLDFATLTNDYKNDVTPVYFHFDDTNVKTAILIWTNSYCALICYHRFQDLLLFELNTTKHTYEKINEFCDINELRRIIDDTFEAKGQIDSGDANANTVPVADGSGGAEWTYPTNAIKNSQVASGDAISLLGFDSQGNVVKDTIPEGIVVDDALDTSSSNAIANQPVAEAIEAIDNSLADAYDSTATYNTGDYVIYENTLYKCKAINVTGTWDATKWDAVNVGDELDTKANKDGNYPTMSVGEADVAKNIKAYSDDSGALQDNPCISQGTGTNNNTEIVTTGDYCEIKSKNGNTMTVNQLLPELSESNWGSGTNANASYDDGIATFTATAQYGLIGGSMPVRQVVDHKYLFIASIKPTTNLNAGNFSLVWNNGVREIGIKLVSATGGVWNNYYQIATSSEVGTSSNIYFYDNRTNGWDTLLLTNFRIIDLTQWFNGNIPQDLLDNPEHFSWYYNGSLDYNAGSSVNANGRYLECGQGRNVWDEVWESGRLSTSNGTTVVDSDYIRSKNYILVIPNVAYYFKKGSYGSSSSDKIIIYDKDYNFIDYYDFTDRTLTMPTNAQYIKFHVYGTTYHNDITISLYYSPEQGGEGYNQHYDYVAPKVIDTGSEVLRSAGSVRDIKTPDGTITRKVGVVDLGTLDWTQTEDYFFIATISGMKPNAYTSTNLMCDKYIVSNVSMAQMLDKSIRYYGSNQSQVMVKDTTYANAQAFKTAMSGVYLQYELAEPTTEQGTPFQAYPDINDYSYMLWRDTDNNLVSVPQGASIFYPVNYAGTLDDLVAYVDGDVTNLAKKSDLASDKAELQGIDTQLKNAIGGTLRQCLCVKESLTFNNTKVVDMGDLFYVYDSTYQAFRPTNLSDNAPVGERTHSIVLSTLYQTVDAKYSSQLGNLTNMCMCQTLDSGGTSPSVWVKNTIYTDPTAFANAMKGVLLAYEKASE